jgi:hypothetical protein
VATKKVMVTHFFEPSLLLTFLDPGFKIRDPGWVKIGIRDKHPGSATLVDSRLIDVGSVREWTNTVMS